MLRRLLIPPFGLLAFLITFALLPLLSSCANAPNPVEELRSPLIAGNGPQADFVDPKGHRFVWQQKLQVAPKTEPTAYRVTGTQIKAFGDPLDAAMLAQKLRPYLFTKDGHEFLGDPLSESEIQGILHGTSSPETATAPPKTDPGVRQGEYVLANNATILDCSRLNFPHSSEVWFDGGCSGILIGPHTVISAGHCFYQYGSWMTNNYIVPAADDGNSTCNATAPFWSWPNWSVAMPTAWVNNADSNYDFAIISVTGEPGNYTGWYSPLNWSNALFAELRRSSFPWLPNGNTRYPVEWRTTGSAGSPWTSVIYSYNNDSWSGDSGGGVYLPSQGRVVGTHIGELSYGCGYFGLSTCYENIYRKWDSTYDSFARAYGNWP